jgi:hypothetical protein
MRRTMPRSRRPNTPADMAARERELLERERWLEREIAMAHPAGHGLRFALGLEDEDGRRKEPERFSTQEEGR